MITTATVVLLVADVALGARLQTSSILGYSPHTAARFTGLGNTAYAVLAASALDHRRHPLRPAGVVPPRRGRGRRPPRPHRRGRRRPLAGLRRRRHLEPRPGVRARGGGPVRAPPHVPGRSCWPAWPPPWSSPSPPGSTCCAPPAPGRTSATFVSDSLRDTETFTTTVSRKWATNVRVFQQSIWTWMVPIVAVLQPVRAGGGQGLEPAAAPWVALPPRRRERHRAGPRLVGSSTIREWWSPRSCSSTSGPS